MAEARAEFASLPVNVGTEKTLSSSSTEFLAGAIIEQEYFPHEVVNTSEIVFQAVGKDAPEGENLPLAVDKSVKPRNRLPEFLKSPVILVSALATSACAWSWGAAEGGAVIGAVIGRYFGHMIASDFRDSKERFMVNAVTIGTGTILGFLLGGTTWAELSVSLAEVNQYVPLGLCLPGVGLFVLGLWIQQRVFKGKVIVQQTHGRKD